MDIERINFGVNLVREMLHFSLRCVWPCFFENITLHFLLEDVISNVCNIESVYFE